VFRQRPHSLPAAFVFTRSHWSSFFAGFGTIHQPLPISLFALALRNGLARRASKSWAGVMFFAIAPAVGSAQPIASASWVSWSFVSPTNTPWRPRPLAPSFPPWPSLRCDVLIVNPFSRYLLRPNTPEVELWRKRAPLVFSVGVWRRGQCPPSPHIAAGARKVHEAPAVISGDVPALQGVRNQ